MQAENVKPLRADRAWQPTGELSPIIAALSGGYTPGRWLDRRTTDGFDIDAA